jgi:hypothetical protein
MRPSNNFRDNQPYLSQSQSDQRQSRPAIFSPTKLKRKPLYFSILSILFFVKLRKSMKRRRHREKILEEWYNTECTYNLDLNIAMQNIRNPMQKS